ncbi:hypothetical protein LAZ67_1004760 [Cordylochernes scorpioides]|uniref:Angiotensin-converting enzyme n=1 Tax=Cordylochernes scorpioides TaxID=51811 RepID=A0ABY6K2I8_9ARAC|nr:hypothetical protein LAZ67_1004760 [Cordylochernes scorpioides]
MKNFVKAMDRNASGFVYLKQKCSSISDAKIKEGIFLGPQIRELLQDGNFQNSLNEVDAAAWNSFRNVCKNFLGSVKYTDLSSTMTQMYGNTKVKVGGKTMELEPDLYKVMSDMNNASAMREAWVAWRDAVGRPLRNFYLRFLNLTNEVARANGNVSPLTNEVARANDFTDMSEMRLDTYETPNFPQTVEDLWEQAKPLYQRLHGYVRVKLKKKFPKVKFPRDGTIPAHLIGNCVNGSPSTYLSMLL